MAIGAQSLRDPIFAELDRLIAEGAQDEPEPEIPQGEYVEVCFDGMSIREAVRAASASGLNVGLQTVYSRIYKGMSLRDAIYRPVQKRPWRLKT